MACICPLCGDLHDRPAAAPNTASPAEAETVLTAARAVAEVRTIWKFPIPIQDQFTIEMPRDAEILHVDTQNNSGCLWVRVVPERTTEVRRFILRRTGHSMYEDCSHIGSFILNDGALAFHLFEPQ